MPNPQLPGGPPQGPSAKGFVFICILAFFATLLIPVIVELSVPAASIGTYQAWAVVTALFDLVAVTSVVLGLGYAVTGKVSGIALSSWNDYSLSKLQMALWTIVILSALFTAAKLNLVGYFGPVQFDQVLAIKIPPELLEAMGIAAFSTAATPAILALKASQDARPEQQAGAQNRVAATTGATADGVVTSGKAVGNATTDTAHWTDVVTGDEVANAGTVDLSKVQQLLITVLLIGTYEFWLLQMFGTSKGALTTLPPLPQQFIELLAVSHASYLAYKAVPKAGTTAPATPDQTNATPPAAPTPPPNSVTIRLTIDDAAAMQGLQLQVDGRNFPIAADGLVELPLDIGIAHRLSASGTRGGNAVSGQVNITPTIDDMDKAYEITLG
jgi:hypothetical protein